MPNEAPEPQTKTSERTDGKRIDSKVMHMIIIIVKSSLGRSYL